MGNVVPSKGLRQGCPLSPYLFLICAKGLASLISRAEADGSIHGIKVARGAPSISHQPFVDDCLIFARDAVEGWEMLTIFENFGKLEASSKVDKFVTRVWSLPSSDCFKLNTDAAMDLDKGRFGAAVPSWFGRFSVEVAEAKIIIEGLLFAEDLGLFPLCVE
ncbi:hypothetical protein Ddye_026648 [Dipteronia dyeriana]|uniref:Reverse transcriptase domain-containing protein n=1 Tax=Dipteronia dyeriana TaxID=168575 RepID=A0AAD9WQN6_9ROSI|nr:hypothetical protein Ddye_026648 [Dipteronia dyeriana]